MRTLLLVFVAICWAGVAVDAMVHLAMGDVVFPASLLAVFVLWCVLWREHYGSRQAAQPAEIQR